MRKDELRVLLDRAGVRPWRGHGQNFLIDDNLAQAVARDGTERVAQEAGLPDAKDDVVLEVGTGPAILTVHLLPRARHVVTVEIEPKLAALARQVMGAATNVTLVEADALASKSELNPALLDALRPHLAAPGSRLRVCANLPYAVATPLLIALLAADLPLVSVVVMVQLEAAERFTAKPGEEPYGAVSVLTRAACTDARIVRRVPPEVFHPRPKVNSAILRLDPSPTRTGELALLTNVVRALFNYRRKTVGKAARLAAQADPALAWLEPAIGSAGVDLRVRPEDLDVDAYRRIARAGRPQV